MSWHHFYEFWVGQQTLPGNILGDLLIGAATFFIGKYKIAPWLHSRHTEHLEQKERQHQELMRAHRELFALHERQHSELLAATLQQGSEVRQAAAPPAEADQ